MADEIVSLRVGKELKEKMKMYSHINWSAILRKVLLEEINKLHRIDRVRAIRALKSADNIRHSGIFNSGKKGVEIIREWRDKRK